MIRLGTRFSAETHAMLEQRYRREPVVDAAALERVEAWERELATFSARMGLWAVIGEALGVAAGKEAEQIEGHGFTLRSRALRALQGANARVYEARRTAEGIGGQETLEHRLGRAAEEMAEARALVGQLAQSRRAA